MSLRFLSHLLRTKMGRTLILVTFVLGGVCPVQLPYSLPVLNATQKSPHSYLISCISLLPEERVTQVHWKARHRNGASSVIAVQHSHWGNVTLPPYQGMVRLDKVDENTYTMEMKVVEEVICCEVVTYPSGKIHENCLNIEEDSDGYRVSTAMLGTLLVGGFFLLGSFVLLLNICWMKKNSRELKLRGQPAWSSNPRPHVPYRRNVPSINLAYEPPLDTELPPTITHPRHPSPRNHISPDAPPPRNQAHDVATPMRNHLLSNDTSPAANIPPLRSHGVHEAPPTPSQIYSNVNRLNKPYRKVQKKPLLPDPPVSGQHQPKSLPHGGSKPPSLIMPNHLLGLCGKSSYPAEENTLWQPPRLHVLRMPESPFSTANPMYHSTRWT